MTRLGNFLHNIDWLSGITGSRAKAALNLVCFKFHPCSTAHGQWGRRRFTFRKSDLSGLHEVLIAREYEFLAPDIAGKQGFTILDCGAHIGLPVLWALTVNSSIRVLSVEASPDTFTLLQDNCKNAGAEWQTINRACWSDESQISFSTKGDSMSHRAAKDGTIKVNGITLRDLVTQFSPDKNIDLMKVDIEGAEEEFLCVSPEILSRIDRIVIELHPKLCDTDRVQDILKNYFSRIETIGGRTSSKPLLYCCKA